MHISGTVRTLALIDARLRNSVAVIFRLLDTSDRNGYDVVSKTNRGELANDFQSEFPIKRHQTTAPVQVKI